MGRDRESKGRIVLTRLDYDDFCDEARHIVTEAREIDRRWKEAVAEITVRMAELSSLRERMAEKMKKLDAVLLKFSVVRKEE